MSLFLFSISYFFTNSFFSNSSLAWLKYRNSSKFSKSKEGSPNLSFLSILRSIKLPQDNTQLLEKINLQRDGVHFLNWDITRSCVLTWRLFGINSRNNGHSATPLWHSEAGIQIFIPYITLCTRKRTINQKVNCMSRQVWGPEGTKSIDHRAGDVNMSNNSTVVI